MATEKHILTLYELSEQEQLNANLLPPGLIMVLKNLLAADTMRLVNLKPNPENYTTYIQEHAEIKGAISAWQCLLNSHEDTISKLSTDPTRS